MDNVPARRDGPQPVPEYVRQLAWLLDDAIPVGNYLANLLSGGARGGSFDGRFARLRNWRVGADGFLSFIPGIGDAAGFALSAAVVLAGAKAGVSTPTLIRMVVYTAFESLAGMVPLAGPVIAFFWKSNDKNLRLIEADLADRHATRRSSLQVLGVAAVMVAVFVTLLLIGLAVLVWGMLRLLDRWVN